MTVHGPKYIRRSNRQREEHPPEWKQDRPIGAHRIGGVHHVLVTADHLGLFVWFESLKNRPGIGAFGKASHRVATLFGHQTLKILGLPKAKLSKRRQKLIVFHRRHDT